jgi:GNAT superfamily N-acetyltransferase
VVAETEGSLIALLLWAEREGGLYCGRLAVDPAARGRGLARALIAAAELEARRRALPRLHVRVRLQLSGNLALFASLGFREIARDAHAGHAEPTVSIMEKRLDP